MKNKRAISASPSNLFACSDRPARFLKPSRSLFYFINLAKLRLNIKDDDRLKSLAFIYLTVKTVLNLSDTETFDCLTEGGGDFGVDAVYISDPIDNEFTVCLFQGKYQRKLEATANFPENGIKALIFAVQRLFDPSFKISHINPRLASKLADILSFIHDGYIPQVRLIACNNGLCWNESTQQEINRIQANLGNQTRVRRVL
ncbi:hypothetical protein BegalDRAFT_1776 [Beggiatoa alba B18LD]|uniref:Uncharacterized protein n=1 Tax=Beggiatoa alba B18LD TaxID=395493 RepID=I3CGA9_9GAMM|nr:hypothetical protein [Beggiatoa alba]EIJ42652.1 hypothetical protein BegalDRAFT_1776 [Beggiatoa alba B18LD]